jgi:hypothetical protein
LFERARRAVTKVVAREHSGAHARNGEWTTEDTEYTESVKKNARNVRCPYCVRAAPGTQLVPSIVRFVTGPTCGMRGDAEEGAVLEQELSVYT